MSEKLLVGFGRADMTPALGVNLGGFGNDDKRPAKQILDPLYATCLAFTDEAGSTALVYTVDMLYAPGWVLPYLSESLGLPVEKIHISGTHTHAAPVRTLEGLLPGTSSDMPAVREYHEIKLKPALVAAGREALADRKPAEMFVAETHPVHMNFVRRYQMDDGSWSGPNFGDWKKTVVAHESKADDRMLLVKFTREGAKDIVMCNFQTHQTMTGGSRKYDVSADGCGAMREAMERRTGCLFAYYTGASGNVVPNSRIESETRFTNEQYKEYGQALADDAIAALAGAEPLPAGSVRTVHRHVEGKVNHSLDHLADKMLPIAQLWGETSNYAQCTALARQIGLNSIYHVQSALGKMSLGRTEGIDLDVVAVGELAFVIAPYEMFDTNGLEIRAASPFGATVVATCANNELSYIPSSLGYAHGGYEVDRCLFVPGFGEEMVGQYTLMLNDLYHER